jgi:Ca-activated chloride channel family protein
MEGTRQRGFIIFIFLITSLYGHGQNKPQKLPEKTRLLFLVDGSGSMLESWGRPNQSKLNVAKSILTKIVDSLRVDAKIEIGLRLYGHRFMPEQKKCTDTELVVPFKPQNHKLIIEKINGINPKGVTPISYALEQAANDFPSTVGYRNIVIIITDGIESCGGDPCATSLALQQKGVILQPYIIGLGLKAEQSLECAGKFVNADTPGKFHDVINQALKVSMGKTTVSVELKGANQKPETNVNITFINSVTGKADYEFVHFLDRNSRPDSVEVDPLSDYDLVVNTVPRIIQRKVNIEKGQHTTVPINALQGNLVIRQEGVSTSAVQSIVREKGKADILHIQQGQQPVRYLVGKYEIETITIPRRTYPVTIEPDKTFTLTLPPYGVVNFNTISSGYGSLYEIREGGTQEWVMSIDNLKPVFSLSMLPGTYKIAFRVKNSGGSKYTSFKTFQVKAGQTSSVSVFQ